MSFSNPNTSNAHVANGVLTTFAIGFAFVRDEQVKVRVIDGDGEDVTPITFSVVGSNVVLDTAPADTFTVLIYRDTSPLHDTLYTTYEFPYPTVNNDLDLIYQLAQENDARLNRALVNDDPLTGAAQVTIADINALEGRMNTAESDIDTAELDIIALEGRMNTAESDIDTAENDIIALEGRMNTAENDIIALEGRMNTAENDIDTAENDIIALEGRMNTAENDIDSLENRVSTNENDILSSELRLDTAELDIIALEGRMNTAENDIDDLENLIDAAIDSGGISPLTTKGDIYAHDAATNVRFPVGTDGQVIIANSSEGTGLEWVDRYPLTTKGDLLIQDNAGVTRLPVGTDGQFLQADSTQGEGMLWADRPANFNYVINGNFDFWQRGTSSGPSAGARYLADRWLSRGIGSTTTITRQTFTLDQTEVPGSPKFFYRHVVSSSAGVTDHQVVGQSIESVLTLQDEVITLSFWAKADSSKQMSIEFSQRYGTGGSPSANDDAQGVLKINLTSSWQKFTHTFKLNSITGKTLGTGGNDALHLIFWFDAGSDFDARTDSLGHQSGTFDIAQVKLEKGSYATDFTLAGGNLAGELAMCQRYYEEFSGPPLVRFTTNEALGGAVTANFYRQTKRAMPTVNVFTNSTKSTSGILVNGTTPSVAIAVQSLPNRVVIWNGGAMPNVGDVANYWIAADAEL